MKLLLPGASLKQRVVHAGFWVFALHGLDRAFGVIRSIFLARLLSPHSFGLFGIAFLAMAAVETLSRTGFEPALIQKKGDIKPYLDVVWTVHAIRGLALSLVLFGAAPMIAAFFNEAGATSLAQCVGLCLLFQGLINPAVVYFQKDLEFHKQFLFSFSGTVVDLVVSVSTAIVLRNAWALVLGLLAGDFVRLVVSFLSHPYRPRLRLGLAPLRELFSYGIWMSFTGMLNFVGTHGPGVVIGKVLGISPLGLYRMAYWIPQATIKEITLAISKVAFPAYVQLKENADNLRVGYLKITGFLLALATPIAFGILILGGDFIRIFLGEQWMPMVPALKVLAIAALINTMAHSGRAVFMTHDHPRIVFYLQCARAATLLIFIYPLTIQWGILGAAGAMLLSRLSLLGFWYANMRVQLGLDLGDIGRVFGPPLISSGFMVGVILAFQSATTVPLSSSALDGLVRFLALLLMGMLSYAVALILCHWIFPWYKLIKRFPMAIRG